MWKQFLTLALAVFLLSSSAQAWPWRFRHLQNDQAPPASDNNAASTTSDNSNASSDNTASSSDEGTSISYDLVGSPPGPLADNDTSFANFSQALDQFYANFSNNSCASQAACLDEGPVLDWVNNNAWNCSLDSGDSCSWNNYSYSIARSNCSDNTSICNETIVSLANVDNVTANWTWDLGQHARNAFLLQNVNNVTIYGECSNGSYCQNLFILSNCSDVNINISCSNNTRCDSIIAGNQTVNVSEWIDCKDQATCGLNVWHQTWSNNSWQWANCSNQSVCGQINTGTNNSNVSQVNAASSQTISQDIVVFENTLNLSQNSSCDNTSTCQIIGTCEIGCGNPLQNFDCGDGANCTNTTNLVLSSPVGTEENATPPTEGTSNEGGSTSANVAPVVVVIPIVYDLINSAPGPLADNDASFGNFSEKLDEFYANFSNNSCASQPGCLDEGPILNWVNTEACTMDDGSECSWSNYSHSVARSSCDGNTSICNETIVSVTDVSAIIANWTWSQGQHARNAFVLQNVDNVTINGECSNGSYCQNLFILNNCSDVTINITCWDNTVCDNIIAANGSSDVSEWIDCHDQATCGLNVWHQTWSSNSWQWANCSNQSVCGQINTGTNNSNVTQINLAWVSSISQDIVEFESTSNLTQNSSCDNTSICQIIAICEVACAAPAANWTCDDGANCTNNASLINTPLLVATVFDVTASETPSWVLPENDTSFGNFSAELDQFYANFSNNSCNSQAGCLDEGPVLEWVNTQNCTMDDGSNCSWSNYSHSVQRSNCSDNMTDICNETIISLSNEYWVIANWTWNQGQHARNAFVLQNVSNVTISGECSNGTYCQNLFILNNVTDITINITCWDNTTCDNIIAANQSANVTEWVDCHQQATCGLNVLHETWTNNSWQQTNCSNQSTCGEINTGTNNTNVTQLNNVSDSSVAQNVVWFESTDGLVQNNTVWPGCTVQNVAYCNIDCTEAYQNSVCLSGATCSNATGIVNTPEESENESEEGENGESSTSGEQSSNGESNNNEGENATPSGNQEGQGVVVSTNTSSENSGEQNSNGESNNNGGENATPSGNQEGQGVVVSTNTSSENSGDNSGENSNANSNNDNDADNTDNAASNAENNDQDADNSQSNANSDQGVTVTTNTSENSTDTSSNSGDNSSGSGDNSGNSGDNSSGTSGDNSGNSGDNSSGNSGDMSTGQQGVVVAAANPNSRRRRLRMV